jgi:hypothetical protein
VEVVAVQVHFKIQIRVFMALAEEGVVVHL